MTLFMASSAGTEQAKGQHRPGRAAGHPRAPAPQTHPAWAWPAGSLLLPLTPE